MLAKNSERKAYNVFDVISNSAELLKEKSLTIHKKCDTH